MSLIYSTTNRIKFTDIPEKYALPRAFRGKQSEVHSAVITYVFEHFKNTKKYKQLVVDALNRLTFCVMQNEPPAYTWSSTNPIETMPDIDIDLVESTLGDFYLTVEAIDWDVSPTDNVVVDIEVPVTSTSSVEVKAKSEPAKTAASVKPTSNKPSKSSSSSTVSNRPLKGVKQSQRSAQPAVSTVLTPKEDLYIQPPKYPRFDVSKVWLSATINGSDLAIYKTLPEIPTKQNEISVTTDLSIMTESELMRLYPNHIIHTRAQQMYENYDGMEYDDDLGCIFPIEGFTKDQIIDNIIRYPHLYKLKKVGVDGTLHSFANTIEIDGELLPSGEVWDTLPESKVIPRQPEFVKEYVIRRYILEEEAGMNHNFKMFGILEPFLTLFMPSASYAQRGYNDVLEIVKQCVTSRVHYKQSRSPIIRRMEKYNA